MLAATLAVLAPSPAAAPAGVAALEQALKRVYEREPGPGARWRRGAMVRVGAREAGLRVMLKPHLEMRGVEPSEQERRILRSGDERAREALFRRLRSRLSQMGAQDHGRIEMRSERDWRRWFGSYQDYLLPYARQAQAAGADLFCVGREMDLTVRRREADWRRLIARVRAEFHGPLTYSANFDDWQTLGFWDALDFIGISAYFPLSERPDPSLAELEDGWERILAPLEAVQRRWGRPLLFTEAGFPSGPGAARAPWQEPRAPADVWLQARCYEATLRALSRRPWIEGAILLALGAQLPAAVPRPLARDRGQAGRVHDRALVRTVASCVND